MYRAGIGFTLVLASASALVTVSPSKAQGTPIVYQTPSGTGSLQKIVGQFGESDYEFLYRIHISDPAAFSATTANSATSGLDTRLYLFTLAGPVSRSMTMTARRISVQRCRPAIACTRASFRETICWRFPALTPCRMGATTTRSLAT